MAGSLPADWLDLDISASPKAIYIVTKLLAFLIIAFFIYSFNETCN